MSFPLTFLLGFSLAVTAVWLKHHLFALPDDWLTIGLPFFVYSAVVSIGMFWLFIRRETFTIGLPRFAILGVIGVIALLIFNTQTFFAGLLPGHVPILPLASWTTANLSFLVKLGAILTTFVLLTGVFAATGNLIIRRFDPSATANSYWFFVRFALGFACWVGFLIMLSMLDTLTSSAIWFIVTLIALYERQYLQSLLQWCIARDIWQLNPRNQATLLIMLGCFIITLNLTEAIRPDPVGYDDMTHYMHLVNFMAEQNALLAGGNPFPFELLATGVRIAAGDDTMMLAMSLGTYSFILGIAVLFAFCRALFDTRTGLIAAIIGLSIPMGPALALAEVKPDALLFPITTLFFWSLYHWINTRTVPYGYFAAFFFGFALSIKLTAAFLIAPFGIAVGILLATTSIISWPRIFRHSFIIGIFFCLPLLPWTGYGISTRTAAEPLSLTAPLQIITSIERAEKPSLTRDIQEESIGLMCLSTGSAEDFARFKTRRESLAAIFFLPWDLTMNLTVASFATEVGFLFLAILPFALLKLSFFRSWPTRTVLNQPAIQLALFAIGYIILWLIYAKHIVWYGYPLLAPLAVLSAWIIVTSRPSRFLTIILTSLLFISLFSNTIVRMKFSAAPERLRYAGGAIPANAFLDATFPGLATIKSAVNRPSLPRVYVTGSRLWYAIEATGHRAYMDSHLDTFECLLKSKGPEGVLKTFRQLDIQYIFFSRTLLQELHSTKNPTFQEKVRHFTDFAGKHLRVVWGSPDYMLFEMPTAPGK